MSKRALILGMLFSLLPSVTVAAPRSPAEQGIHQVDVLEFPDLRDERRGGRPVPIKVHFPVSGGPFPLVVFSHGGGGNWDANFAQARHLATHGYVVLCPAHPGSTTERMTKGFRIRKNLREMTRDAEEVLGRPRDISFAIDSAEAWSRSDPILKGKFDLSRIGVAGHSFGAYTALVACGARPALDWLVPPISPGKGLGPDLSDPRVDACVALSPQDPGEPFFLESSYDSVKRPVLGISGTLDEAQNGTPEHRQRSFELMPPGNKRFLWLIDADHLSFSDSSGSGRRGLWTKYRTDAQPVVQGATLMFFNGYLGSTVPAHGFFDETALRSLLQGKVREIRVLIK